LAAADGIVTNGIAVKAEIERQHAEDGDVTMSAPEASSSVYRRLIRHRAMVWATLVLAAAGVWAFATLRPMRSRT
jgi:hypothetical protein